MSRDQDHYRDALLAIGRLVVTKIPFKALPDNPDAAALATIVRAVESLVVGEKPKPIPMLLWCPECGERHVDEGMFAATDHHTHACQHCGHVWRPALVATKGVQFLPGFKNE